MEKETKKTATLKTSGKTNGTKKEPKRLSKLGEFMRSGKSYGKIVDMRAVLK